jgi:Tol biopolymer transport system component/tRNA A-37 threonylcarbamoyl transferase component Bud32
MPLSADDKLGPYEILALIGKGGMGEVYRARDPRLNRDVAIKVSAAQFSERFAREAKTIAALNHPNICQIYDVGPNYLVMEYIEGEAPKGPMPLDETLHIARQIADGLEAAHDKGITHRDLKPGNIKIKPDGTVKVLDFGLAKIVVAPRASGEDSPTLTMGMTEVGMILGTAAYMAPEQACGKESVDKRVDIWAFGVVLYELITGQRLFQGEDAGHTLAAVIMQEPDFNALPKDTPSRVRRLIERCLRKDPKLRLRDIGDARILLDEPEPAPLVAQRSPRRAWLPWVVAGAALALAAAAYWRGPAPERPRVHSFVLPPERSTFRCGGDDGDPAVLSPDGKRLAFGAETDGKVRLWVRPLDSATAQALAGTEGATFPFWSHDGRWLGFFADGKLKKVEAAGGTVTVLADASANRGGAWNQDDVILFAPTFTSGLVAVPAAGGAVIPVTRRDEKRQEISHRWPSFLPDGKHFLFTSRGKGVFVAALDGKDAPRRLLEESSDAIYSAGYLLYERGNMLLARRFDASRAEFTRAAVTLAQNMAVEAASDRGCFTAANGLLAYHPRLAESRLTWIDRSGNRAGTVGPAGAFGGIEISPDGTRVATVVADSAGVNTTWVYDLARGTKNRVFPESGYFSPVWSPDGKRLAIGLPRDGGYVVISRDADGSGGEEVLLRSPFEIGPTGWLADGGFVLVARDPKTGFDIDSLSPAAQGRDRVRVPVLHADGDQTNGIVSPNGRWMLYLSDEGYGGFNTDAFVARFPEAGSRRHVSTAGAETVRWSRDGKEIFFSIRAKLMSAQVREIGDTLEIAEPRLLFEMRSDCSRNHSWGACFDVAPDGKRLLVMEGTESAPPLALVQNWEAGLKK